MNMSAAVLKKMLDKGLSLSDVVEIVEIWEEGSAQEVTLSPGALRTRRYRAKQAEKAESVTKPVTVTRDGDDQRVSPEPPSEITPIPPLKGGTFPKTTPSQPEKPSASAKQISAWVGEIWDLTPSAARARTSKADIERALKSALRRDHAAEDVIAGLAAYFDSPDATKDGGRFAKGAHRVIENDRWQAFEPELKRPAVDANPWPKRLTAYRINGYWHSDWGPKPGKPGCTVPTEALMTAGYQPPPTNKVPEGEAA